MAGQLLGLSVAEYFIARCGAADPATQPHAWMFSGDKYPGTQDFTGRELFDHATGKRIEAEDPADATKKYGAMMQAMQVTASPGLEWLWGEAAKGWL